MIGHQIRAIAVCGALVLAVLGLWTGLNTAPQPGAATVPNQDPASASTGPREALDTLDPPDDLGHALAVAQTFADSLYKSDVAAMHELVTPALARTLLPSTRQEPAPSGRVEVEGTITRDVQPDRVLVDVIVRRRTGRDERLETVTVSVIRSGGRWLIDDVAF